VARVVIQTKQHLAALVPVGPGLVLNLLRWGADIRPWTTCRCLPKTRRRRA
jgi:DNA end-binding protein Ku